MVVDEKKGKAQTVIQCKPKVGKASEKDQLAFIDTVKGLLSFLTDQKLELDAEKALGGVIEEDSVVSEVDKLKYQ